MGVYIVVCLFGLIVHPFFYAIQLVDFFRIRALSNVINAVANPRWLFYYVLVLFLVLEYYFTLLSYILFWEDYND